MDYLEVIDGHGQRRQYALQQTRLLLGRDASCDIQLPQPQIPLRQAQIQLNEEGQWVLQALSLGHHIYYYDRPVKHLILEPKKPFRIGDFWLVLKEESSDPLAEVEQWGLTPRTEARGQTELPWLEPLQIFQRSLRLMDEPKVLLESLGREYQRILKPGWLAIGRQHRDQYHWEVVLGNQDDDGYQQALDQADKQRLRNSATLHSWVNMPNAPVPAPAPEEGNATVSLLIPLKGRRGSMGHIYIDHPGVHPVPVPVRRYLSLVASYAALALENMEMRQNLQAQALLEQEMQHARQIQLGLFPDTFALDPRLEAFGVNLPSTQVSGDYFDLFRVGPDKIAFVIADAMGHGMPAALMMAGVRAALRMGLTQQLDWTSIFDGLHQLVSMARAESYVTGIVGLIDFASKDLTLVCAGHPPASVVIDGRSVEIPATGLTGPWGVDLEHPWQPARISLDCAHWSILAYTDGISELANSHQSQGTHLLREYHRLHHQRRPEDLCQNLLHALRNRFSHDDQTLLALSSAIL